MNRNDLKGTLERERINPRWYSIAGGTRPPIAVQGVLAETKGKWVVYYFERGERTGLRVFESEDEACRYFLDWALSIQDPKLRLK